MIEKTTENLAYNDAVHAPNKNKSDVKGQIVQVSTSFGEVYFQERILIDKTALEKRNCKTALNIEQILHFFKSWGQNMFEVLIRK